MEGTETNLMQKMPSGPESEADRSRCVKQNVGSDLQQTMFKDVVDAGHVSKQVLPFCFVKIWPKDADPKCRIRESCWRWIKNILRYLKRSRKRGMLTKIHMLYDFLLHFFICSQEETILFSFNFHSYKNHNFKSNNDIHNFN